ncbi:putative baseplate assembly protein [Tolypothrix sp. FACHB-123]|uniref:putative baseplate assembly protein n=1 Tax=Tolypothrix sp. FACHB-123 TaxID=2692868 RepID=UPI0016894C79|nr:putative baseplate assembly protein [Tolypothrix sp. FACHB-123]MBD2358711.1 putative baseplate assembly protein [Tolypothrix sp. FACHB-123]
MVDKIPKIDKRTSADIEKQVKDLLYKSMGWQEPSSDAAKSQKKGINIALIKIFARYCEIIIERLNKVPEKNFLAFLDLLGASRLPPQSARVPLTFSLSDKSTVDAVVPKGTQVAAQLAAGEKQPVIFETENELVVTAAKLESVFVRDDKKKYADYGSIITAPASTDDLFVFSGSQPIEKLLNSPDLQIETAFSNNLRVDLINDFFPFGENPKFGNILYLAHSQIFAQKDIKIIIDIKLVPLEDDSTTPEAEPSHNLKLKWEYWNGNNWEELKNGFKDTTNGLTTEGQIEFKFDEQPVKTKVNNLENFWIRVRIISRNYGDYAAPLISYITVSYTLTPKEEKNDPPSLYFGFSLPSEVKEFPNRPISMFIDLVEPKYDYDEKSKEGSVTEIAKNEPIQLFWQYWNGKDWVKFTVSDGTKNFTCSGVITFLPPKDFTARQDFGLLFRYWLRVQKNPGNYQIEPKLRRVLLNTVMAVHSVTIRNEILGSSDSSENQKFRTVRSPILRSQLSVLGSQQLEVREPELASAEELATLKKEEGDNPVTTVFDSTGRPKEIWVRWHEVPDFYGSTARDRHYVINHLTGEIQFGNGLNGLIPPLAKSNIRMAYYQTGGGIVGNKPAGTIVQLKTTVPYVNKVTNYEAAVGGAEAETRESLIERVPRRIRHRGRAVTSEDFEDLAKESSLEVARAKCVPLRNLVANPFNENKVPGAVSVIIVPHSTDNKPLPSLELMNKVQEYLEACADPTINIYVVGPLYVSINVKTEIFLNSLESASTIEREVEQKLASFLHPLTGGVDRNGWDFGRLPHQSDLYALLIAIPGIDYISSVDIYSDEEYENELPKEIPKDIPNNSPEKSNTLLKKLKTERFIVYSGKHNISLKVANK